MVSELYIYIRPKGDVKLRVENGISIYREETRVDTDRQTDRQGIKRK